MMSRRKVNIKRKSQIVKVGFPSHRGWGEQRGLSKQLFKPSMHLHPVRLVTQLKAPIPFSSQNTLMWQGNLRILVCACCISFGVDVM